LSLFNRYEYNPNTGLIGKGGFSRVYKAFDKRLNRWVALKIYKGGEFADRYSPIAEIRRVVNLDHSNICRYLDIEEIEKENSFGEIETTQICVMELLDGGTFAQYYNAHKDEKTLKKLLNDVLNGLSYLHKNGIVHRDIKPANILIKETIDGPVAKITDFGISKASDSVNNNSSSALIVSIPYMAPEQLNVKKYGINEKITYNLDLWSLGVTVYEVVTGKVLFKNSEQDSSEQIMTNIMAPELPEKIQELSQPFRDIVSHCIVKDAKDRAQKAEELIVLLHGNYEDASPPVLAPPVPKTESVSEAKTTVKVKKSFFIENEEDEGSAGKTGRSKTGKKNSPPAAERPQVPNNADRKKRTVFIGIVASFIIVFLAITFYFMTRNNKEDLSTIPVKKADTTTKLSNAPAKTPVQTPAATTDVPPSSPAKTESVPAEQPTSANAEKKPRKAAANTDNENVPAAGNSNQKYVLILTSTQSCTVKINKEDYGKLEAGKTLKVYLVPGTYVLQATSLSNSASVYNGNLEVTEKNRSQVGQYRIPLP
jgi:serine/threonine protein kinase